MNYRQWKKNYKKRHGVNPPASIDKRKRSAGEMQKPRLQKLPVSTMQERRGK